jgi:hypothetical protein
VQNYKNSLVSEGVLRKNTETANKILGNREKQLILQ